VIALDAHAVLPATATCLGEIYDEIVVETPVAVNVNPTITGLKIGNEAVTMPTLPAVTQEESASVIVPVDRSWGAV
jgi:hypothetical protein